MSTAADRTSESRADPQYTRRDPSRTFDSLSYGVVLRNAVTIGQIAPGISLTLTGSRPARGWSVRPL